MRLTSIIFWEQDHSVLCLNYSKICACIHRLVVPCFGCENEILVWSPVVAVSRSTKKNRQLPYSISFHYSGILHLRKSTLRKETPRILNSSLRIVTKGNTRRITLGAGFIGLVQSNRIFLNRIKT